MKHELLMLLGYFAFLMLSVRLFHKRVQSDTEFILGNRSLNFWLTALSAHASDMSAWLLLGYLALVFEGGVPASWVAIGLVIGMFCNWQFVAPRLRGLTGKLGSLTLSSYFEACCTGSGKSLRLISCAMSIFFFTCYISSGLCAIGVLSESLLGIEYSVGITIGLIVVSIYVFSGGYRTVAWIDLVQGFFLLGVILFIALFLLVQIGGFSPLFEAISHRNLPTSLFPTGFGINWWQPFLIAASWGLGYFGQPQILTKFMGIRQAQEIPKAKYLGMGWQILSLGAATLVGLIAVFFFPQGLEDTQHVILDLVKLTCAPFVAGIVLCAIVAATTNVMAAQLLVVASHLSEDLYKPYIDPKASSRELLMVSRCGVLGVAAIALVIALFKISTVYKIVLYAWSGLGASFGPLVLFSLYTKKMSAKAAFQGVLAGGITAALWPTLDGLLGWGIPPIIPGYLFSCCVIQWQLMRDKKLALLATSQE